MTAKIQDFDQIWIYFADEIPECKVQDFVFAPGLKIFSIENRDDAIVLRTESINLATTYKLKFKGNQILVETGDVFDRIYSASELGCFWDHRETFFRVFAPRAKWVKLELFETFEQQKGAVHEMHRHSDGVWEVRLPGNYLGYFYGYKLDRPVDGMEYFDANTLICDPYSKVVATRNEYLHPGKSLIMETDEFDWENDKPVSIAPEDLMIYECHLRDMTAHKSSGVDEKIKGSYKGFIQSGIKGGLEYIKSLGMNTVEFLPLQEFGNMEHPYGKNLNGSTNTWNPYARNHWGYMTSYFFAPESYYASNGTMIEGNVNGLDGKQVSEFKEVVKACHKDGIAVILDVVFNHVSQYDRNPFKHIDKHYYFRLNDDNSYCSASGCGNDFKTERAMSRKMIVDCIKYWMREYHIDGFRFDLAAMIDMETVDLIREEATKINPNVHLIAEPWGGGYYNPSEFSEHGWAAWNDQVRNGVKGQNPDNGLGYIFGHYFEFNNKSTIQRYITGNLVNNGGLFQDKRHSINYLESHDDHTFGDFVRLGLRQAFYDKVVAGTPNQVLLTPEQLTLNKFGALILMICQGPVMISEGQEFARSKVIAPTLVPDSHMGRIDHNSYNKDNETNWINFEHAEINRELFDYYKGLISLRHEHPVFRKSDEENIEFFEHPDPLFVSCMFHKAETGDTNDFLVYLNGNTEKSIAVDLLKGDWCLVVDHEYAGTQPICDIKVKSLTIPPSSGMILRK